MSDPQKALVIVPDTRSGHSRSVTVVSNAQGRSFRSILSSVSLPLSIPWCPRKPSSPTPSNPILLQPANSCFPDSSLQAGWLHPQARTLGYFLPSLAAWTLLDSLLSDTHIPHIPMERMIVKDTALHTCLTAWTTSWMWELLISLLSLLIELEFYKGTESINYYSYK